MNLTIEHILDLIEQLPTNVKFDYVSGGDSKAKLVSVDRDNAKVDIVRVNADGSEKNASMTTDILNTLVLNIRENKPFKFDNVLNGSGNVRSTMEAIFAHTTEFYFCKIGRVKHLIWVPSVPHEIGKIIDYSTIKKDKDEQQRYVLRLEGNNRKYLTALRTKPFMLLAGISGTGKSRIVRKLAQASITEDLQKMYDPKSVERGFNRWQLHKPANFELVQVKPNWHNSLEVVGYKSNIGGSHYEFTPFVEFVARAWKHQNIPFFLCLDEMNLAPVEQYFAEFLSAIESRSIENGEYETDPIIKPFSEFDTRDDNGNVTDKLSDRMIAKLVGKLDTQTKSDIADRFRTKGLTLPKNLLVLGTVNMDETTFSFSRKVLDRAMSIVMNDVEYDKFFTGETENDMVEFNDATKKLLIDRPIRGLEAEDNGAEQVEQYLTAINEVLNDTPFKLGYRAANEALLYVSAAHQFDSSIDVNTALDEFTLMKILSRIEGDKRSIENLLDDLQSVINDSYPASNKKLVQMAKTLQSKQFVSYWT